MVYQASYHDIMISAIVSNMIIKMIYRASKWKSKESPRSSRSSEAWPDAYLCLNILKDNCINMVAELN